MIRSFLIMILLVSKAYGTLAGGRPNSFSGGQNAFAGVINPANAVWIADRLDIGVFWFYQNASLTNKNNNPSFLPGKTDFTYKTKNLFTTDAAIHKKFKSDNFECSWTIASYTTPSIVKLHTKRAIPALGSTPLFVSNKTEILSAIFSLKLNNSHSVGWAVEYYSLSHRRNGFQNADNPLRSVSPGHVTNNGKDHSNGMGFTVGWRWNISKRLDFGTAWTRKSPCGQFRRYRGYEPYHAHNYNAQTVGAGFTYLISPRIRGRLECIWSNLGNLPNANNNILPNGKRNLNKRGSSKSPGAGLQDATFINVGAGYKFNSILSIGTGFSHRIKLRQSPIIISHSYSQQTIYNLLSLGANLNFTKHEIFISMSYGFKNRRTGTLLKEAGPGRFVAEKQTASLSFSWGYLY